MRNKLLMLILIFLLLIVTVPSTWSYFFTYTKAAGTISIDLHDDTDIDECVTGTVKEVTITANQNSDPVFVRVKVFKAPDVTVSPAENEKWTLVNGDYYYYKPIDGVDGDPFDNKAVVSFTVSIPSGYAQDETRHVVVVYEGTPALFTTTQPSSGVYWTEMDGDTVVGYWYADWNTVLPNLAVEEGD